MPVGGGTRAAEILRRLSSEEPLLPEVGAAEHEERSPLRWSWPRFTGPWRPAAALAVVATLLVAGGVVLLRRPAPIEQRLPLAAETAVAASSTGDGSGSADPAPSGASEAPAGTGPTGADSTGAGQAGAGSTGAGSTGAGPVLVHVAGAVASPGVVELSGPARVIDAVRAAGGLRSDADPDRVNLAAPLIDGQRIVIPVIGQEPPTELAQPTPPAQRDADDTAGASGGSTGTPGSGADSNLVDVNTADAVELERLPGVGPATAAAIIAHREQHGAFTSVEELIEVRGIGEAKLEAMRDMVTIGGP